MLSAWLLPGVYVDDYFTAITVAIVLGLLNVFLKPLLVLLTIPITIVTFGLFLLVINALIILMVDDFVGGFTVNGFWWALLFSLVLSFVSSIMEGLGEQGNETTR
jgi:putative membrane protein